MDRICITDMSMRCVLGVSEEERRRKQEVVVSVCLHADLSRASTSDDLAETVDYEAVEQRIADAVENSQFHLLEALGEAVAQACLDSDRIRQVDVTVENPGALRLARAASVHISRKKREALGK